MSRFVINISSPRPAVEVFDYMARFSNAALWDPGVAAATDVDGGDVRVGSRFDLQVRFAGRMLPLRYTVTELEPSGSVVVEAANAFVRSRDRITVRSHGDGSVLRYEALLEPRGLAWVTAPLLAASFRTIGRRAEAGLRAALGAVDETVDR